MGYEGVRKPACTGIIAAVAGPSGASESCYWLLGLTGAEVRAPAEMTKMPSYFTAQYMADPLAFPAISPEMLAKFPPTLVLSSSRDALLGNALDTYARLVDAKVESQLYVREGFGHGYFTQAPEIPEAIAAWRVTVDFFDRHLFRAK